VSRGRVHINTKILRHHTAAGEYLDLVMKYSTSRPDSNNFWYSHHGEQVRMMASFRFQNLPVHGLS